MKREYYQWHSPHLNRKMELLVFGHSGSRVIFFPPRMARFFDYENWGIIKSLEEKIEKGYIQVYCVDSVDTESLYNKNIHPQDRIKRNIEFEKYIINELIPFTETINNHPFIIAAGCSLGAYHALNISLKNPENFNKTVCMSGRFDITKNLAHYTDLFDGFHNEEIYFNIPPQYMANLEDTSIIEKIKKIDIIFAVGNEDPCLQSNEMMCDILWRKNIHNQLYIWNTEAHKACYWREMVKIYL